MHDGHPPADAPDERQRDDPVEEALADYAPSDEDPLLVVIGQHLTVADYRTMAEQAAVVRSLAEQLRGILRCHPDDLPLW